MKILHAALLCASVAECLLYLGSRACCTGRLHSSDLDHHRQHVHVFPLSVRFSISYFHYIADVDFHTFPGGRNAFQIAFVRSSRDKLTDSSGAGNEHILYFDLPIWEGIGVHLGKVETCLGTDKFLPLRSDVPVVGMQEAAESVPVSTIPSLQNLTMNIGNICYWRFSL